MVAFSGNQPGGKLLSSGRSKSPAPAEEGVRDVFASNLRTFDTQPDKRREGG